MLSRFLIWFADAGKWHKFLVVVLVSIIYELLLRSFFKSKIWKIECSDQNLLIFNILLFKNTINKNSRVPFKSKVSLLPLIMIWFDLIQLLHFCFRRLICIYTSHRHIAALIELNVLSFLLLWFSYFSFPSNNILCIAKQAK